MSQSLEQAAIEAVFHRQLSTERATRYVATQAGVSAEQALEALQFVMTSYRNRS